MTKTPLKIMAGEYIGNIPAHRDFDNTLNTLVDMSGQDIAVNGSAIFQGSIITTPNTGLVAGYIVDQACVLHSGLAKSLFRCIVSPTAPTMFILEHHNALGVSEIGSFAFDTMGDVSVSFPEDIAFERGDVLTIKLPEQANDLAQVFWAISSDAGELAMVTLAEIPGLAVPITGETPVTTINSAQYTGAVTWEPSHTTFQGGVAYTANVVLTPKFGYTFNGVPENFFTFGGSTCTNMAGSGNISISAFPVTFIPSSFDFLSIVATSDIIGHPGQTATDPDGNIYVVDCTNHCIKKFDSDFNLLMSYGTAGTDAGQLWAPRGVARDALGNFYVTDYSRRVQKFDSSFHFLGGFSGTFNFIEEIAVDSAYNIYVVDYMDNAIKKFNSSFASVGSITGLNYPMGVTVGPDGKIYVSDSSNNVIKIYNSSLGYISQFGGQGIGDGQFNGPCSISFDPSGNIYVVEFTGHRVQVFDPSWNFLGKFGTYGTSSGGEFWAPKAVAFDLSANIYVCNHYGNNIQKFAKL